MQISINSWFLWDILSYISRSHAWNCGRSGTRGSWVSPVTQNDAKAPPEKKKFHFHLIRRKMVIPS